VCYLTALALLVGAGAFNMWSRADERGGRIVFDPTPLPARIGDWKLAGEVKADADVHRMLAQDAIQWYRYKRDGQTADLLVLYGHRKRTFHLPDSCLAGAGIDIRARHVVVLTMPDGSMVPFHALMLYESVSGFEQSENPETPRVALYTFVGPSGNPTDLLGLNAGMLWCRVRGQGPKGAAVRVIGPIDPNKPLASQPICDLAISALKEVCKRVEKAGPAKSQVEKSQENRGLSPIFAEEVRPWPMS
jgi:hypothetical protein